MTRLSPTKSIRLKCLECSAGSSREVDYCPVNPCPLWPWRFGQRPETARKRGKVVEPPEPTLDPSQEGDGDYEAT